MAFRPLIVLCFVLFLAQVIEAGDAGDRGRPFRQRPSAGTITVGQQAPDFDLVRFESAGTGRERVRLSSFRGKKPVVLIFSSYT
jgi:hypothetical protein